MLNQYCLQTLCRNTICFCSLIAVQLSVLGQDVGERAPLPIPVVEELRSVPDGEIIQQKQDRLRELEDQINQLMDRITSPPISAQVPVPPPEALPSVAPAPPSLPLTVTPAVPSTNEAPDPLPPLPAPEVTRPTGMTPPAPVLPLTGIVEGKVDRMSLASSLFATGRYQECLNTLEQVEATHLHADDVIWKTYMTACCHRGLGNVKEAASIYRGIAGRSESDWTRDLARWWLDHLQEKNALVEQDRQIKQVLTDARKGLDELN